LQVELTDREFEKLLAAEEKQKKEGRLKKKGRRDKRSSRSRVLNRKHDRRSKVKNDSKSDESGNEVKFFDVVINCYIY